MTLIAGLCCSDAVVLASDSQITVAGLKKTGQKLFCTKHGIIWGTAGPTSAAQALEARLEETIMGANPGGRDGWDAIRSAIKAVASELARPDGSLHGGSFTALFAWHSKADGRNHLLKAGSNGVTEFMSDYGTVGSAADIAGYAFFGFSRSDFLEYRTLPVEAAKMLTHIVADDAVRAAASGVNGPIQLAVASTE
jgi:hypothetical protein